MAARSCRPGAPGWMHGWCMGRWISAGLCAALRPARLVHLYGAGVARSQFYQQTWLSAPATTLLGCWRSGTRQGACIMHALFYILYHDSTHRYIFSL
jgi:hypothetical protein